MCNSMTILILENFCNLKKKGDPLYLETVFLDPKNSPFQENLFS